MKLTRPIRYGTGYISQRFGENPFKYGYGADGHRGQDYGGCAGQEILAPCDGTATAAWDEKGYGEWVRLRNGRLEVRCAHMVRGSAAPGGQVRAGQRIGIVGATGNCAGAHLHVEVWLDGERLDPADYLRETEAAPAALGWHLGFNEAISETDWRILRLCPPGVVTFLPDYPLSRQAIHPDDIRRLLAISPECRFVVRPHLPPAMAANDSDLLAYFDACKRLMDDYTPAIPEGQRLFQVFNEPNRPLGEGWEGFGDQLAEMQRLNQVFCRAYKALKAHNASWQIGFPPLAPGDRDAWFTGDPLRHHYLHGLEGCKELMSLADFQAAAASGPCHEALDLADVLFAHVYLHHGPDAWKQRPLGRRMERYHRFCDKPVIITQAGFPNEACIRVSWAEEALFQWLAWLPAFVVGAALWVLGRGAWGAPWYDGDRPSRLVHRLAEWLRGNKPEAREPLPEDEPATDGPTLRQKVRWWTEEAMRCYEAGDRARFEAIMYSLVRVPNGLMYRSERTD